MLENKRKVRFCIRTNYIGMKFGKLTPVERLPKYKGNKTYYKCKCDCGHEKNISGNNLCSGHTKTCGLCERESKKRKDLTGKRFGRLVVQEMLYRYNGNNTTYCKCICDCGNIKEIYRGNLLKGTIKSCGCLEKESRYGRTHGIDLTGDRFGHLYVVKKTDKRANNGGIIWTCRCDCGNEIEVRAGNLIQGKTRSCGCNKTSKYEEQVEEILASNSVSYHKEHIFSECKNIFPLRFDFYLPEHNTCIECQGQQHYIPVKAWGGEEKLEATQKNDQIKVQFCKDNDIDLVLLPYTLSKSEVETTITNILYPCND